MPDNGRKIILQCENDFHTSCEWSNYHSGKHFFGKRKRIRPIQLQFSTFSQARSLLCEFKPKITASSLEVATLPAQCAWSCGTDPFKPRAPCFPAILHVIQSFQKIKLGTSERFTNEVTAPG